VGYSPLFPGFRAIALHPGLYAAVRIRGLKFNGCHVLELSSRENLIERVNQRAELRRWLIAAEQARTYTSIVAMLNPCYKGPMISVNESPIKLRMGE